MTLLPYAAMFGAKWSKIFALANLGGSFLIPAGPGDGSYLSGVLGTFGRTKVFLFSGALWS